MLGDDIIKPMYKHYNELLMDTYSQWKTGRFSTAYSAFSNELNAEIAGQLFMGTTAALNTLRKETKNARI